MFKKFQFKPVIIFVTFAAFIIPPLFVDNNIAQAVADSRNQPPEHYPNSTNELHHDISPVPVPIGWEEKHSYKNGLLRDYELDIQYDVKKDKFFLLFTKFDVEEALKHFHMKIAKIYVDLDLRLIYNELTMHNFDDICSGHLSTALNPKNIDPIDYCKSYLYTGITNNTSELDYCERQQLKWEFSTADPIAFELSNILPYQIYELNISLSWDGLLQTDGVGTKLCCTGESRPIRPPYADLTSFEYQKSSDSDNNSEKVHLYWRPLPRLLAGSQFFTHSYRCRFINSTTNGMTKGLSIGQNLSSEIGHILLDIPVDTDLECHVASLNRHGYSKSMSRISVPRRIKAIDFGEKFRFVVFEVSKLKYRFEWTPFKVHSTNGSVSVENSSIGSQQTFEMLGNFTFYWCFRGIEHQCEHLDGFVRVENRATASYELTFPEYSYVQFANPRFGMAYMWRYPWNSTGIIWDKCGFIVEDRLVIHPMKLALSNIEVNDEHRLLSISWDFPDCDPIAFKIKTYEFNLCQAHNSGCWWSRSKPDEDRPEFRVDDDGACETHKFDNGFKEELHHPIDLKSKYYIRARYILVNGTFSEWSSPLTILADCTISWWGWLILPIFFIVLGAVLYKKGTSWYVYSRNILYRFKNTRANVSYCVDMKGKLESEFIARKYCVNRETTDFAGELSLNMLECMDGLMANGNDDDQSIDYIPRKLIENNNDQSTPENFSDSMRDTTKGDDTFEHDEISISSRSSSFCNNILSETPTTGPSSGCNN
jgi:hypothetical protein